MKKRIIYIDMDDVLCNYSVAHANALIENPSISYPQNQSNFFVNLEPISGAVDGVKELSKFYDVYILTAPSVRNPLCYTEKRLWIENKLGYEMAKRLIISPNKGLNKGAYLIDDHIDGAGQENFEGELLQFGSTKFKDWKAVLGYFKNKHF